MMKKSNYATQDRQQGATLIEALVSILVLSLGLLGMAGLQLNALSFQKSSWATHRIAELTSDIGERIRANSLGDQNGRYTYQNTYAVARDAVLAATGCRAQASADCTFGQIANDDLAEWLAKSQRLLPGGAVRLEGNGSLGYTITAMYIDKDFVDAAGLAQASAVCNAATAGIAWRNCCPAAAAVPVGVRCYRSNIVSLVP
jgi:type IV pilus assembly protein PilV